MSNPITNREQGSVIPSQASRITDSAQASYEYKTKWLTKNKNQTEQKSTKIATKSNLDAESANEAIKPLTKARARFLASQESQANENHSLATSADYDLITTHAPAPSGSRLTIKRIKDKLT